jgi:hypothetical protein|tara:strand:- start:117 stop:374 length:258 start_codon:yes stop_codon:yes gene_type:complete
VYKNKKAPSRKAPFLAQTKDNAIHWSWCIRNKISICVIPDWNTVDKWLVEIKIKDKISIDPKKYEGIEALAKMYEYCKYYYNKNN